jgi:hypothetical protein
MAVIMRHKTPEFGIRHERSLCGATAMGKSTCKQ